VKVRSKNQVGYDM